jgi:predicted transcriptional regulator
MKALNVRLPDDLRRRLDEAVKESGRSLNAEIVWRLRRSFDGWKQ